MTERIPNASSHTLCWSCSHSYSVGDAACPQCNAANANVDPDKAQAQCARSERGITQDQRAAAADSVAPATEEASVSHAEQTAAHPTPRTEKNTYRGSEVVAITGDEEEWVRAVVCKNMERENAELRAVNAVVSNGLRDEIAELLAQIAGVKEALAGDDYASLPSDYPLVRMAHTIRADHDKFRNQVIDTCNRADKAERQRDEARKDAERYLDAIFQMADDGWLMHGEEGMDDTQEVVYAIAQEHPEYKRRVADAAKEKTNG